MRRFGAQLILLLAALIVVHAQCVLACSLDECRQATLPPCHRHHNAGRCNQDQVVAAAHASLADLPAWTVAGTPSQDIAASPAAQAPAFSPLRSPVVLPLTPIRI